MCSSNTFLKSPTKNWFGPPRKVSAVCSTLCLWVSACPCTLLSVSKWGWSHYCSLYSFLKTGNVTLFSLIVAEGLQNCVNQATTYHWIVRGCSLEMSLLIFSCLLLSHFRQGRCPWLVGLSVFDCSRHFLLCFSWTLEKACKLRGRKGDYSIEQVQ